MDLRCLALDALAEPDPSKKAASVEAGWALALAGCEADANLELTSRLPLPGRPERPRLVEPGAVPRRSPFTLEGRAALLHAVAHIEFNAINLALDAVWRYADMPPAFLRHWLLLAHDQARPLNLLRSHSQPPGAAPSGAAKSNTSMGGSRACSPRANTDLPVPRPPAITTPPRPGSTAAKRRANLRVPWPVMAASGNERAATPLATMEAPNPRTVDASLADQPMATGQGSGRIATALGANLGDPAATLPAERPPPAQPHAPSVPPPPPHPRPHPTP